MVRWRTAVPLLYSQAVAVRRQRSISVPPGLDAQLKAAARARAMTYSAWLTATDADDLSGVAAAVNRLLRGGTSLPPAPGEAVVLAARGGPSSVGTK